MRRKAADDRAAKVRKQIDAVKAKGAVSLRQIAAALNDRGITSPRGGEWSAAQVQRAMEG
jgi:hypothetical protein